MIVFTVLAEPTVDALAQAVLQYEKMAQAFEWRMDCLLEIDLGALNALRKKLRKPVLLTLRTEAHGGFFRGSDDLYWEWIEKLSALQPEYMDIESHARLTPLKRKFPNIRWIYARHQLNGFSETAAQTLEEMAACGVWGVKLISKVSNTLEAIRCMNLLKEKSKTMRLCMHAMGVGTEWTRVLSSVLGARFTYVIPKDSRLFQAGMLSQETLHTRYRLTQLNTDTQLYALIGNPVSQSVGDIFHNKIFEDEKRNAVYAKLDLTEEDLPYFFEKTAHWPWQGLSVTMPLKQAVLSYCNVSEPLQHMGAVNTLKRMAQGWSGWNTDCDAFCSVLSSHSILQDTPVLVLGAGGMARAAIAALQTLGADIFLWNRTVEKARVLCEAFEIKLWQEEPHSFAVVINTTATSVDRLSCAEALSSYQESLWVESRYGDNTKTHPFAKDNRWISGVEIFKAQAHRQQAIWFDGGA